MTKNNLKTTLPRGVEMANPIMTASGTFGFGDEIPDLVNIEGLGGIITKSVTLEPREGHPPPRIAETPSGMLNAIGLANPGVEEFCRSKLPGMNELPTRVFVSIAGSTMDEYAATLEQIEAQAPQIAGYEINVSCPNVDEGGMEFGVSCPLTEALTRRLRDLTDRFLMVKLSPNVTDIASVAMAAQDGGADAVSAINTVVGMDIDPHTGTPALSSALGGLSGPAIRPIALACVYKISRAVDIPVIGLGGITSVEDVIRFFRAGAKAVQIGTANYRDPSIGVRLAGELLDYLADHSLTSLNDIMETAVS